VIELCVSTSCEPLSSLLKWSQRTPSKEIPARTSTGRWIQRSLQASAVPCQHYETAGMPHAGFRMHSDSDSECITRGQNPRVLMVRCATWSSSPNRHVMFAVVVVAKTLRTSRKEGRRPAAPAAAHAHDQAQHLLHINDLPAAYNQAQHYK
jgi:hypothetical protein